MDSETQHGFDFGDSCVSIDTDVRFIYHGPVLPKPRMTKSDRWKKRPVVTKYWAMKDKLVEQARDGGYELPDTLHIRIEIGVSKSWSKKKKAARIGKPHQNKPDLDNILKGIQDCLAKDDQYIHTYESVKKVWCEEGQDKIIFYK